MVLALFQLPIRCSWIELLLKFDSAVGKGIEQISFWQAPDTRQFTAQIANKPHRDG